MHTMKVIHACKHCGKLSQQFDERRSKYWCLDCIRQGYKDYRDRLKSKFPKGTLTRCPKCQEIRPSWLLNVCELCTKEQAKKDSYTRLGRLLGPYFEAKDKPCTRCGQKYHLAAMEFHHRARDTKAGSVISFIYQPKKMWREIAKCDVVCANCHAIITYEENRLYGSSIYYPYDALEQYIR